MGSICIINLKKIGPTIESSGIIKKKKKKIFPEINSVTQYDEINFIV